jgi:galactose mutarotase-like enzyme
MPAGLGFHPFFPRTPPTVVRARVGGLWLTDDEVLPLRHLEPPPPDQDPGPGLRPAIAGLIRAPGAAILGAATGWTGGGQEAASV